MTNNYDTLQIDTPENVTFDYDVSGIGSRFLAALVDAILLGIVEAIIIGALVWILAAFDTFLSKTAQTWVFAIFGILAFIFFWSYHSFFEILWNGQTPGKKLVGIRVIRLDGTPVAATEVLIRNLIRIIDFFPFAYGIGVVTMFFNQNSRRLGDLAAGTVVIHDKKPKALKDLSSLRVQVAKEDAIIQLPTGFPIEKLDTNDLHIIEDYLARREGFSNRKSLAAHILKSIAAKHSITEESIASSNAEDVLESIHGTVQNREVE